jgi:hypothetical protein
MNPLSVEWTMGMNEEQKKNFELIIRNNSQLVRQMNQILDQWEKELDRGEFTIKDFSEPNWANKQAFRNGDRSRIKKLKDLFNI